MSSRRQRKANYRNSLLSTGPKAESLEHTRFNGVTHGARSRTTVLPRENLEAYNRSGRRLERRLSAAHPGRSGARARDRQRSVEASCASRVLKTSGWPPGSETRARAKRLPSSRKWNGSSGTRGGRAHVRPVAPGPWRAADFVFRASR